MLSSLTERPIPNLSHLRGIKHQYPAQAIDFDQPLIEESIVSLADYGIAGTSYYSQPNKATGEPLPGINPEALARQSVAEKLVMVKEELWTSDELARELGGRAELIVRDALRSLGLQKYLFEVVWPNILMNANPDWDQDRLALELPKVVGKPSGKLESPTPHMTGGAVDVDLILEDGTKIDFGHVRGTSIAQTDYHEGYDLLEDHPVNIRAQRVRRALYWAMSRQDFANHPYEFWHYSYGDQMWALFGHKPAALYAGVEGAPDVLA